jgi:hypothetical protein
MISLIVLLYLIKFVFEGICHCDFLLLLLVLCLSPILTWLSETL